jgi:hypothetical protein
MSVAAQASGLSALPTICSPEYSTCRLLYIQDSYGIIYKKNLKSTMKPLLLAIYVNWEKHKVSCKQHSLLNLSFITTVTCNAFFALILKVGSGRKKTEKIIKYVRLNN